VTRYGSQQDGRTAGWAHQGVRLTGVTSRPTRWGDPFRVGSTYMWLAGEENRTWPVPTSGEPGGHPDGVRVVRCPDTATAVTWFRYWARGDYTAEARRLLRGHDLACWCPLDRPRHADVSSVVSAGQVGDRSALEGVERSTADRRSSTTGRRGGDPSASDDRSVSSISPGRRPGP
jgi:Domain of unknown function (DUF4326)